MNEEIEQIPINIDEEPAALEEVMKGVKGGKAAGYDNIMTEMIKIFGQGGGDRLLEIINRVWETESILEDWRVALVVSILKTGDKKDCINYRRITLLGVLM